MSHRAEKEFSFEGQGRVLAFSLNDHYRLKIASRYWYGDDSSKHFVAGDRIRPIAIALIESTTLGIGYSLAMDDNDSIVLMKTPGHMTVEVYLDVRTTRYRFCACNPTLSGTAPVDGDYVVWRERALSLAADLFRGIGANERLRDSLTEAAIACQQALDACRDISKFREVVSSLEGLHNYQKHAEMLRRLCSVLGVPVDDS